MKELEWQRAQLIRYQKEQMAKAKAAKAKATNAPKASAPKLGPKGTNTPRVSLSRAFLQENLTLTDAHRKQCPLAVLPRSYHKRINYPREPPQSMEPLPRLRKPMVLLRKRLKQTERLQRHHKQMESRRRLLSRTERLQKRSKQLEKHHRLLSLMVLPNENSSPHY